ncbi:MAG TPA: HNH endonuclease signature motif containing protein [Candidatus Krumholzibacteria bacterium]|nr:HNH endonuclease signature motif containing protein [Candidatus Krumholzibacteria bacterium]
MGAAQVRIEPRKVFKFTTTDAFEKKFERIKSLAWHRLGPNPSFELVFELAMDCFLEKEDPMARRERREKRGERARAADSQATADSVVANQATGTKPDHGARYISAAVRDQVFVRDRGRCTYSGPNGNRCASTRALQVDHISPVARGGASTCDNLRLLCAYHNRLEAERLMGGRGRPGAS